MNKEDIIKIRERFLKECFDGTNYGTDYGDLRNDRELDNFFAKTFKDKDIKKPNNKIK